MRPGVDGGEQVDPGASNGSDRGSGTVLFMVRVQDPEDINSLFFVTGFLALKSIPKVVGPKFLLNLLRSV